MLASSLKNIFAHHHHCLGCSYSLLSFLWCDAQVVRDKSGIIARVIANVSSAIVFSCIYWRLGHKQANIQDRMGLMQVSPGWKV